MRYTQETLIVARRNRVTKTVVRLEHHPAEDPSCRWTTICEAHDLTCGHKTRSVATSFLSVPWEWCEECPEP